MAGVNLAVIALISGGKDSLFSILHCLEQGHKIVALANLHPSIKELDDVDSYMYQTVGHGVIPLYEDALGIPLYRQPITGSAANTSRDYHAPAQEDPDDETEALVPLLLRVKAAHPQANAISTGAILSTYQRTRVESVALRLGLIPLSYLWQYPSLPPYTQSQLLRDMQAVGLDARIVKVASGGLDESFLGLNVADERVIRRLVRSAERFGSAGDGAVLGEGGEFETLAVDGPKQLWKKRILLNEGTIVQGEGGSAMLRIGQASLGEKASWAEHAARSVRKPALLDHEFLRLLQDLRTSEAPGEDDGLDSPHSSGAGLWQPAALKPSPSYFWTQNQIGRTLYIANMASPDRGETRGQMQEIATKLQTLLQTHGLGITPTNIVSTLLLLRSMSDFGDANLIYGSLFTEPNPPARVTVACGACMPVGVDVMLSVVVDLQPPIARAGLHVQSRSYWAPANIGPYSQAIAVEVPRTERQRLTEEDCEQGGNGGSGKSRLVYVAGQIPLVPSTMVLAADKEVEEIISGHERTESDLFLVRAVLSLQHLWRIGRAMDIQWWSGAVVFLPSANSGVVAQQRVSAAISAWRRIHQVIAEDTAAQVKGDEEEEDEGSAVDVWDVQNRVRHDGLMKASDAPWHPLLPVFANAPASDEGNYSPPVFAVEVEELPRHADVEWMSWGLTTTDLHFESNASESSYKLRVRGTQLETTFAALETENDLRKCLQKLPDGSHCTVFLSGIDIGGDRATERTLSLVPCRYVWNERGNKVAALVVASHGSKLEEE